MFAVLLYFPFKFRKVSAILKVRVVLVEPLRVMSSVGVVVVIEMRLVFLPKDVTHFGNMMQTILRGGGCTAEVLDGRARL